jgi:hypothetical protein
MPIHRLFKVKGKANMKSIMKIKTKIMWVDVFCSCCTPTNTKTSNTGGWAYYTYTRKLIVGYVANNNYGHCPIWESKITKRSIKELKRGMGGRERGGGGEWREGEREKERERERERVGMNAHQNC